MNDFDEFNDAVDFINTGSVLSSATKNDLLYLYARFKQVKSGDCPEDHPQPSIFDFERKQKLKSWKALKGVSQMEAARQYVDKVFSLAPSWHNQRKQKSEVFGGNRVSVMLPPATLEDKNKSVYDWCQLGDVEKVAHYCENNASSWTIDDQDPDSGLSLMHWAADRGDLSMVETLIQLGANVNMQDTDGFTPLHYAVSCSHLHIEEFLLKHSARTDITDNDGNIPEDLR